MLRIDRNKRVFVALDGPKLADESIKEVRDLQEWIFNSPSAFFPEIGQELFVIGKEIQPSETVQDRIDLLCVNKEGACVIVELKRGTHKLHMLQAISYAGMLSGWSTDDILVLLSEKQREDLTDFLDCDIEEVNRSQRIILIAEAFDFALLMATAWLCEQYGVDIACCQVNMAKDSVSGAEYLVCSNVYPSPELAERAAPRGKGRGKGLITKPNDWNAALARVKNDAVVNFYRDQLASKQESRLANGVLYFRINGRRCWSLKLRITTVYVWQYARFDGDLDLWRNGLSDPDNVQPVKDGTRLRFYLSTAEDFKFFKTQSDVKLLQVQWIDTVDVEPEEESDVEVCA